MLLCTFSEFMLAVAYMNVECTKCNSACCRLSCIAAIASGRTLLKVPAVLVCLCSKYRTIIYGITLFSDTAGQPDEQPVNYRRSFLRRISCSDRSRKKVDD